MIKGDNTVHKFQSVLKTRREKGFTLVEMAIVLVIIGLILSALSVGKDLQRNANYKQIINKFVGQWAQAYNQYYERTGLVLADNETTPTGKVGGRTGTNGSEWSGATLSGEMNSWGIKVPLGDGGAPDGVGRTRLTYHDTAGRPHTLLVSFIYQNLRAANSGGNLVGNLMKIQDVAPQLASTMDSLIDGEIGYSAGNFRTEADFARTQEENDNEVGVTAWWKMTQ
ncbi:MAG: type II secretion system protein [Magnetococcales bacterium]|nr:type II secretion system protein [Magnetococcales bacterium]